MLTESWRWTRMSLPKMGTLNFASVWALSHPSQREYGCGVQGLTEPPSNPPAPLCSPINTILPVSRGRHQALHWPGSAGSQDCPCLHPSWLYLGLAVVQRSVVVAWRGFGLRTRNTLCGKGPTAPADSKTQKEVIPLIPCQTFPDELETKMVCFDNPNLSTSELLVPSTVGHRGSSKGWTHHQRKGADISNFSSITVTITETSLT